MSRIYNAEVPKMEQRLIDANALLDTMEHLAQGCFGQGQCYYERTNVSLLTFLQLIKKQPTVDAVLVVKCKYCKHHEVCKNGVNGWCNKHERPTDVTYFCADGERKDGDTDGE